MNIEISVNEKRILFLSMSIMTIFLYFNNGWTTHTDSIVYTKHLDFIVGGDTSNNISESLNPRLILRPLLFYLAAPFYFFFGSETGIGVLNSFFYLLSGIMMYRFVLTNYKDEDLAFFSSVYFVSAFPVLYWGLAILADMGTWFFLLLSLLLIRKQNLEFNTLHSFLVPIIIGLGILYKFDLLVIPIFITLSLFHRSGITDFPAKYFIIFATFVILPILINQIYVNYNYGFNYYHDFILQIFSGSATSDDIYLDDDYAFKYTQTYRILTFFIAFPLLFPLVIIGFRSLRNIDSDLFTSSIIYVISSLIIILGWGSSLSYIGAGSPRYAFLLFPVFVPLTIIGLNKVISRMKISFVALNKFDNKKIAFSFFVIFSVTNLIVAIFSSEVRQFLNLWEW